MILEFEEFSPTASPKSLVIMLHGYGSNKNDLIDLAPELQQFLPDAAYLSVDGIQQWEEGAGRARQWFSLGDREPDYMHQGIKEAHPILDSFIDEQLKRFNLNNNKLALLGFSQGAMMALHVGLRRSSEIGAILAYSGLMVAPHTLHDTIVTKPKTMLIHGIEDTIVPITAMQQAAIALDNENVIHECISCPNLAHGIDELGINKGGKFLQANLS